ncbi:MAG: LysM peptidoglycan-binding domain-containing protein, partial [Cyclobacteriaceae bacterium]
ERKNIAAASLGAAKYFKRNNYFVKNWMYAVSAYQAGPGGVKRYLDDKFVGTDRLTVDKNTHWYAKRFIAHVIAFRDEIGQPHSDGLYLQEYTEGQGKSLGDIAKELQIDVAEIEKYNKWLRSGKIPEDKQYIVIVPYVGKAPKIREEAKEPESADPPPLSRSTEIAAKPEKIVYPDEIVAELGKSKVIFKYNGIDAIISRKGDDKESLAKRGNTDKRRFDKYNEMLPGQPLAAQEIFYLSKKKNKSSTFFHVANENESLWQISQRYGVKVGKLEKYNREERSSTFKNGRIIYLKKKRPQGEPEYTKLINEDNFENRPTPAPRVSTTTSDPVDLDRLEKKSKSKTSEFEEDNTTYDIHIVEPGESLWGIANKYNISVAQLLEWNGMFEGETISPGQNLQIGAPVEVVVASSKDQEEEITETPTPEKIINKPQNGIHIVTLGETLSAIAAMYGMEMDLLAELNALNPGSFLAVGQELFVDAQEDVAIVFEELKEENIVEPQKEPEPESKENTSIHVVAKGETLYGIARQYGMPIGTLLALNDLNSSSALSVGQELFVSSETEKEVVVEKQVPVEEVEPVEDEAMIVEKSNEDIPTPSSEKSKIHTVTSGETLYGIARQYNLSVNDLLAFNNLEKASALSIGQKLRISENNNEQTSEPAVIKDEPKVNKTEPEKPISNNAKTHSVGRGETLYGIASQYNISVKQLLAWNNFEPNTAIQPGQIVNVSEPSSNDKPAVKETVIDDVETPKVEKSKIHIVRGGDTLYKIASQYGMTVSELKKLNDKKENSLSVGEELKVKN